MGKLLSMVGYPDLGYQPASLPIGVLNLHSTSDAIVNGLGTTLHHTTAYHPQSNSLVERFRWNLKEALKACLGTPDWVQTLHVSSWASGLPPKEDLGCSIAEMVYGTPLFIPRDFIPSPNHEPAHRAAVREIKEQAAQLAPSVQPNMVIPNQAFHPN